MDGRELMQWSDLGGASRFLAEAAHGDGFVPDVILGIARGGLLPAAAVAYALGVKNTFTMNVEFYTGVDERLAQPEILPPPLDGASLAGRRVLLVDDVSDSGRTLALAVELLQGLDADVRSVTLYTKPRTILVPDYCWRTTDRWIVFPWSALPPVTESA